MNDLLFESIFAIFAFATTRYILPNTLLKRKIYINELIILSICYGLCSFMRKYASIRSES